PGTLSAAAHRRRLRSRNRARAVCARKYLSQTTRRAASRTRVNQAPVRTELAIRLRTLRSDEENSHRGPARDSHRADGERQLPFVDSRTEQPLDLQLQHHRISLLRSRFRRHVQCGVVADYLSRTSTVARFGAARWWSSQSQLPYPTQRGAHLTEQRRW